MFQRSQNNQKWKVHKFGGTSVLNAERYKNVYQILMGGNLSSKNPKAIVVSAMKGVTDDLIRCTEMAQQQNEAYKKLLSQIHDRHANEVSSLLTDKNLKNSLLTVFKNDFDELSEILRGVWLVKNASERIVELISGCGEVWSAQILNAYFQQNELSSNWIDARKILVVNHSDRRVLVNWEKSKQKFDEWLQLNSSCQLIAITGFVASLEDGTITTLGRNGSDYSASIFGALFDCDEIFIWTDVDGILSADPKLVPEAVILDEMSYNEVTELAYFGAKVVHPSTMTPAIAKQIPIWIKNSLNPTCPGTKIFNEAKSNRPVKGFSTIDKMCLINVEGAGLAGVPGVAERLFGSLRTADVSIVLISQASSEHSICLSVSEVQMTVAKKSIESAFYGEIHLGIITGISITTDVSILAIVGDNMVHVPGIAGQFFTSLGKAGVNIRAIAQGSSERNISVVIDSKDAIRALRAVHSSFILPHQTISIGLVGPGSIGSTFLLQLERQLEKLKQSKGIDIQVRGLADSKKMYLSNEAIDLTQWKNLFSSKSVPVDLEIFADHIKASHIPHSVIIDATANSTIVPLYSNWLRKGIHIISPNKKSNTGSMNEYLEIRKMAKKTNCHFLYSTHVGAGLPIIQTLKDLHSTGDEIFMIQGILSGTLSFIFNQFDGSQPFSEIVKLAKDRGYTEPDPREDLSGQDFARKLVILAREMGANIEVSDVQVQNLVSPKLSSITCDQFLKQLNESNELIFNELDEPMSKYLSTAKNDQKILRFIGTIKNDGTAEVKLETLSKDHPFSSVSGTDNILLFKTKRYLEQPLVIKGPGAGPEVTAAGVFADLLRLSQYLGANSGASL